MADPVVVDFGEARLRSSSTSQAPNAQQAGGFDINAQLGQMMWEAGTKQVKDTFFSYGRIDIFRPYFDVEPRQVRARLVQSFIPRKPTPNATKSLDLYGPTMVVLTLVALLLFGMKISGFVVQNGTLMGTALFTAFGFWIFASGSLWALAFVLSADGQSLVQILALFGYSLTSVCVLLLLTSSFQALHSHFAFFILLAILCGPAAIRLGLRVSSTARDPSHRLTLLVAAVALHLLYAAYLHFGFHAMVEEIDEMLGNLQPDAAIVATGQQTVISQ